MAAGWGVDATLDAQNNVVSGTTDADIRKVWGALYTPGIISGSTITRSSSAMTYTVAPGVVAIRIANGEVVMAPHTGGTVTVATAPATGTRTDIVWVRQRFPNLHNTSELIVEAGTTLPASAHVLGRFIVSAGQTGTAAAVPTGGIDYSIPYGASLGVLHRWQDKSSKNLPMQTHPPVRYGHGTIYLPTDRRVRFSYSTTLHAASARGFDNSGYCEYAYIPSLDNSDFVQWTTPGLHQAWMTLHFEQTIEVSAGTHTVNIGYRGVIGPGTARQEGGVFEGYGREGAIFTVEDVGPVK